METIEGRGGAVSRPAAVDGDQAYSLLGHDVLYSLPRCFVTEALGCAEHARNDGPRDLVAALQSADFIAIDGRVLEGSVVAAFQPLQ